MGGSVKVGGAYRNAAPYAKVGGVWKFAPEAWTKVSGAWKRWFLAGGIVDSEFNAIDTGYSGANGTVSAIVFQPDGKTVIGGGFGTWNTISVFRIARIDATGQLDAGFTANTGTASNSTVSALGLQSDGKIIVGGGFTTWNGASTNRILCLNSDGTRNTAFNTNLGTASNNSVAAIKVQSDDKIIVGGTFTSWNGVAANRIIRLNADGTTDSTFMTNIGTGANNSTTSIALQSDGKILVAGNFTDWNGTTANRIVRLNSDGTLDTAFTANTGTGANSTISALAIQPDGKVLAGGTFTTWNSTLVYRIARLNSDGTLDTTFATNNGTGANNGVSTIFAQSDGKVLVGGLFATWNGATVGRIVRLNSDGTRDTTFSINVGAASTSTVSVIALQSDEKIVVGGAFSTWDGRAVNRLVRLNPDGVKNNFNTVQGPNAIPYFASVQSNGKAIVVGTFTAWGDYIAGRIVRLNSDATVDTAFVTNNGTGANNVVATILEQPDGKILVGGFFTAWNGTTANRIVRLNSDGTLDTAFSANIGIGPGDAVNTIALQSDGKIIVGGGFFNWDATQVGYIARLNSDGTRDVTFNNNSGTGGDGDIRAVTVRSDGKILAVGNFTNWNSLTTKGIVLLDSDGTRNSTFSTNVGTGANSTVETIGIQSDGKIVVGGNFTTWDGVASNYIACLNADGTRNSTFTSNLLPGPAGRIYAIKIQSDDKIVAVGDVGFNYWNTTTVNRIARINPDGTLDSNFTTNAGTGFSNSTLLGLAIRPDGRIIAVGNFVFYNSIRKNQIIQIGGDLAA